MPAARTSPRRFSRRTLLRTGTGLAAGLVVGEGAYGALYERHHLGVTRADLPCRGLPEALDGLRIGLITDTHHSAWTSLEFIAAAVDLVREAAPDMVVLGGDYITRRSRHYTAQAAAPFAALRPKEGLFGVLGNHDDNAGVPRVLRRAGVTVLDDARTRITVRGERLDLVGLNYWTRDLASLQRLARGRTPFTILLAHDPRRLYEAAALDIPLVLSGHTHGGQLALPVIGRLATDKYPVAQGIGHERDTTLFVSRGVGTVLVPCRLNCPPEVAIVTLRRRREA
ncbi:hypothetical protein TBR22_A05350 [Luteitalea sp. TBR-22]|uniref:metallophosphoesterase n=1 Tax=Luteitalea sp. TBR-22 TaxID=2802971 RepID=UPI001AF127C2|nr:metallophosphoesterase [Luteitalea sp. TBR-22]BCS31335.1 hypothetical protein TBR22_A05350 [Luteitalea sp. TBR-22]